MLRGGARTPRHRDSGDGVFCVKAFGLSLVAVRGVDYECREANDYASGHDSPAPTVTQRALLLNAAVYLPRLTAPVSRGTLTVNREAFDGKLLIPAPAVVPENITTRVGVAACTAKYAKS